MKDTRCEICKKEEFRYTCPKCGVVYCSLACYKNHSEECTESFYRENIEKELKNKKVSEDEKKKFEKILANLHQLEKEGSDEDEEEDFEEEENEEEEEDAETRIEYLMKLAQDDSLKESDLTEREMREFRSALKKGTLNEYFQPYTPWWMDVSSDLKESESNLNCCHICCSEKQKVNLKVVYTVAQTIYAYIHYFRKSNGEIFEEVPFGVQYILAIAQTLWQKEVPSSMCIEAVLLHVTKPPVLSDDRIFDVMCLVDLSKILYFRDFVLKCINDVLKLVKLAQDGLTLEVQKEMMQKQYIGNRLVSVEKKLKFLKSFVFFHFEHFALIKKMVDDIFDSYINQIQLENSVNEKKNVNRNELKSLLICNKEDEVESVLTDAMGSVSISNTKKQTASILNKLNDQNSIKNATRSSNSDANNNYKQKPLIEIVETSCIKK